MAVSGISNINVASQSSLLSVGESSDGSREALEYVDPKVAEKEQKAVFWSKLLVVVVLFLAVIAMATFTFILTSNNEENEFRSQFKNYASEIYVMSNENARNIFKVVEAFSVYMSTFTADTNQTWPFVFIPHFSVRANRVMEIAGADRLSITCYITEENKPHWEEFVNENINRNIHDVIDFSHINLTVSDYEKNPHIFRHVRYRNGTLEKIREENNGPYLVHWHMMPLLPKKMFHNANLLAATAPLANSSFLMNVTKQPSLSFAILGGNVESVLIYPIFEEVPTYGGIGKKIVGATFASFKWKEFFDKLLPDHSNGIIIVVHSGCGHVVTFGVNGLSTTFLGAEDLHDPKYDDMRLSFDFMRIPIDEKIGLREGRCVTQITLNVYPSDVMRDDFMTNVPYYYTAFVVAVFLFTTMVFILFDFFVRRHQRKVMDRVIDQDKIVSNIFPSNIRTRLYATENRLNKFNPDDPDEDLDYMDGGAPIADLYPSCTVLFADIVGFTAWSSTREPHQVFLLLESIYGVFDKLAYPRYVFKVETVGDCYVAVAGLPEPRKRHATSIAKFARDCLHKMKQLTKKLEITLGPDTTDLDLRLGINSGQVTGGVLRGERSRFQLFGDTVNTAAGMESTGRKGRIQISQVTAEALRMEGRAKWIKPRDEKILLKGKGHTQTYWLETKAESALREKNAAITRDGFAMAPIEEQEMNVNATISESESEISESVQLNGEELQTETDFMTKIERLVEWNVDVLSALLQQILAARLESTSNNLAKVEKTIGIGSTVLEEFQEIITLPKITVKDLKKRRDLNSIELSDYVIAQLREFIRNVAKKYRANAFHNFEHASHVTSSVRKLLSRIVQRDDENNYEGDPGFTNLLCHSYGITSDPLTQFSVVFSAVIHDMDHPGVTNAQLVKEKSPLAGKYKETSVAEQNSVDLAWNMLMQPQYKDLRSCIYADAAELKRFRQLVVNTVMATDICDKELQALRKARWAMAFAETADLDSTPENDMDRKATIVIEHLIQASDVAHTMQHWEVYHRWNERFFMECYGAYKTGRVDSDPSPGWYKGEIGFFDFYVIPLAKKLESCGVFGVSSYEYLNYATANREEWERKGQEAVREYLEKYESLHSSS